MEARGRKCNTTSINVNNLLEQCTDSSNGNQSHPLYHLTKITKLLQYNIDSLHESKYLVAPKVITFFFFFLNQQLIKKNMSIKIMFLLLLTKNMKADSLIKSEG